MDINSSIRLFADENPVQLSVLLDSDLSQIYTWASNWLVTLNPSKTESVLFSRELIKPIQPALHMNHQQINAVTFHKHLEITFSNDLSWQEHFESIKIKA